MLGADKRYDTNGFVSDLREMCLTLHVAQKAKGSYERTQSPGYKA